MKSVASSLEMTGGQEDILTRSDHLLSLGMTMVKYPPASDGSFLDVSVVRQHSPHMGRGRKHTCMYSGSMCPYGLLKKPRCLIADFVLMTLFNPNHLS